VVTSQNSLHFEEIRASSFPNCGQMNTITAMKSPVELSPISNRSTQSMIAGGPLSHLRDFHGILTNIPCRPL